MASLIAWKYDRIKRCYIFKKTNGRKVSIQKRKRVLRLGEGFLREVLAMNVPLANECKESRRLIRALQNRFEGRVVEEEGRGDVVGWRFLEGSRTVRVNWSGGSMVYMPAWELLQSNDAELLHQITALWPQNQSPSAAISQFQVDLRQRLAVVRQHEDTFGDADSEGGEGTYLSEDMEEDDYYG